MLQVPFKHHIVRPTVRLSVGCISVHVLVIEDEIATVEHLVLGLLAAGHSVDWSGTGREGFARAQERGFGALVVDRMLPDVDGLTLVTMLRVRHIDTPILMLTTMGGIDDRVDGLNAGADDYLVKPFSMPEFVARIEALGRRHKAADNSRLEIGGLVLDKYARTVTRGGKAVSLQQREYQILLVLMENAGNVVTRKMLIEQVWNYDFDPQTNIVESHLSRLRTKIDKGFDVHLIHTVRNFGYSLHE